MNITNNVEAARRGACDGGRTSASDTRGRWPH